MGGSYAKLSEPASESCVSLEMLQPGKCSAAPALAAGEAECWTCGEYSPISEYINKGGTAEYSVPVKGWNLRRTILLYYWPQNRRSKDLQNSIFPESVLINIRTPERSDVDHRPFVIGGNMRN